MYLVIKALIQSIETRYFDRRNIIQSRNYED